METKGKRDSVVDQGEAFLGQTVRRTVMRIETGWLDLTRWNHLTFTRVVAVDQWGQKPDWNELRG